jgi:mono/diheme cytochrome c family protein
MRFAPIAILLLAGAAPGQAETKAKATAAPTFSKDVAPILFGHCATCHRPGEAAPFSLLSYKDAKKRGKLLATVTQSRQMPPWKADTGDVSFRNERRLTTEQIAVLQQWVKAGMVEGDPTQTPKPPAFADGWPLGKPDLVVKMPKAYRVAAEGRDIYRNFAIALNLKEDKWVRAMDFRPTARSVVHHTLFFLDPTGTAAKREAASGEVGFRGNMGGLGRGGAGRFGGLRGGLSGEGGPQSGSTAGLGGWALGAQPRELPSGLAYRLPKGSDLILSTHFHPSGKVEHEASTVAFYFADKAPVQRFTGLQLPFGFGILAGINIPAGKKDFAIEDSFVLPVDVKAFGVSAHAHYLAKQFTLKATPPGGKTKTLLSIPDWDFAWQEQYQFKDFVSLPKGTKIEVKITYDNSVDNPRNPTKPPRRVRWGRESTDEMGSITLQVVAAKEADFPRLQDGYRQHVRDSLRKTPLKKLFEKKP